MSERERDGEERGLPDELRALGRLMEGPDGAGPTMAERVLAQIVAERVPTPVAEPRGPRAWLRRAGCWARMRRRVLAAVVCGVAAVAVLTSPVRAAVADWFGFGGVEVRHDPSSAPSAGARVPGCGTSLSLEEAARRAGFEPLIPTGLGPPDTVSVAREPHDRTLLSLCWRDEGRTIRLDEFPARLDVGFAKTVPVPPRWVEVGRETGLWFVRDHRLSFWMLGDDGDRWTRSERTAGPTLLWPHGDFTLRLEGVGSEAEALRIARSVPEGDPR
ncbi:hypothetical protein GTY65_30785 [Streptomyces sp. SID8379]|uniref:hypothetical protein n=1 Tax=unclassified Streptomyces TaxID=2593676 RepID=UPI0005B870CC|nr:MULTISPECIES: hypothetical protein [unclassified Streptomyces]MYW68428.1 hypothetical protein [Streptomyces sp. SID8379]